MARKYSCLILAIFLITMVLKTVAFGDTFVKSLPLTNATAHDPAPDIYFLEGLSMGGSTGYINPESGLIYHNAQIAAAAPTLVSGGWARIGITVEDGIVSDNFTVDKNGHYKLILRGTLNGGVYEGSYCVPVPVVPPFSWIPTCFGKTVGGVFIAGHLRGENPSDYSVYNLHEVQDDLIDLINDITVASAKNIISAYVPGGNQINQLYDLLISLDESKEWENEIFQIISYNYLEANKTYKWSFYVRSVLSSAQLGLGTGLGLYEIEISNLSADLYSTDDSIVHSVIGSSGQNGSIIPLGNISVEDNQEITFYASPNQGYKVKTWYVNGVMVGGGANGLTIENVQENKTVWVTFEPEAALLTHNGPWAVSSGGNFSINGNIFNTLGNGIDGITVNAKINGSIVGQGITDASGYYSIPTVSAPSTTGQYTINIEAVYPGQILNALDILTVSSDTTTHTISTATEFINYMSNPANMDKKFKLIADIDLDDLNNGADKIFSTAIIAPDESSNEGYQGTPFTGKFNGQGFRIRHININATGTGNDYLALFGKIGAGGRVINLRLTSGVDIRTGDNSKYVGGIAGYNDDGYIINCEIDGDRILAGNNNSYLGRLVGYDNRGLIEACFVNGSVLSGGNTLYAGGLIGEANASTIYNCYATGNIRGHENSQYLGGLIGKATECTISNSFATGWLEGREGCSYLGGLIGGSYDDCTITSCYATGEVRSEDPGNYMIYVGGLVGELEDSNIIECYSTSSINAPDTKYAGGLTGRNHDGSKISRSFYQGSVTADDYIGGITGRNFIDCTISDSYVAGTINGVSTVGGIAGENQTNCNITNCYSVALINASSWTGGIIGDSYDSTVNNCYFLDTSAFDNGYGLSLTDSQMKLLASYDGWAFNIIWQPPNNDYPQLMWQVEKVIVPDVVGLSQAIAESVITSAGLAVGTIISVYSNTVPAGNVISQSPISSSSVVTGSAVEIIISLGQLQVPEFVDELAVDFGGNGLWHYDGTWNQLNAQNPEAMEEWDGGLAADFAASGLWNYNGSSWDLLTTLNPQGMKKWTNGLAVDFGTFGLWNYNGSTWDLLTTNDPQDMESWTDGLAIDFGTFGLWNFDGSSWGLLTTSDPQDMQAWANGLAVDFGTFGLWNYNGSSWDLLTTSDAQSMEAWSGGLSVDFSTFGLWNYNGLSWNLLTTSNAEFMAAWASGLAVDFGGTGLWSYDGSSWDLLTTSNAQDMEGWATSLAVDLGASGLWNYDGSSWVNLTGWDSEDVIDVDLY